jgi:hypothetical protein
MHVRIEILHDRENIRKLLQHHGWQIDRASREATYWARHPTIIDEASARHRLNESGLLTSPALRIEFFPYAT